MEFICPHDGCDWEGESHNALNGHITGKHKHPHQRGEIKHGTRYGYHRCRRRPEGSCDECRQWNREFHREARRRKKRRVW